MTSGCIGQIHLPASDGSITRPPAATFGRTVARTNISGFSLPSRLDTLTRTLTVRVLSLSTG